MPPSESKIEIARERDGDSYIDATLEHAQSQIDRLTQATARLAEDASHTERLATLGMLAAGIAHEINNILTPVLAYAQMAAARPDDAELRAKCVEKTVRGVELATHVADTVLGFAGRCDHETEASVNDVVGASLDCLSGEPNKDRILVSVEIPPGTSVRINPLSLQQVMLNLIINARAAMTGQGGKSNQSSKGRARNSNRLTISALPRADGTVGIRISDTGPGIPREIAGRIFEPFVTSKNNGSGGGLGLAICRRLIEQAGGTITAISKPGDGTTFSIILPASRTRRAKAG